MPITDKELAELKVDPLRFENGDPGMVKLFQMKRSIDQLIKRHNRLVDLSMGQLRMQQPATDPLTITMNSRRFLVQLGFLCRCVCPLPISTMNHMIFPCFCEICGKIVPVDPDESD